MTIEIVYETHSITEDNERGIATGWLPGRLSPRGRELAAGLGRRRRDDGLAAVFSSDLARAAETASIAFGGSPIPVLLDWRLRECDYGSHNGTAAAELLAHRPYHLDDPYPGGESWRQAVTRVGRFLAGSRLSRSEKSKADRQASCWGGPGCAGTAARWTSFWPWSHWPSRGRSSCLPAIPTTCAA